jgi:hypothetical protein
MVRPVRARHAWRMAQLGQPTIGGLWQPMVRPVRARHAWRMVTMPERCQGAVLDVVASDSMVTQ